MFPAETLELIITISRQPKNMRPCYCGRDAIALTSPISDTNGDSVEDTQTSLTEEIRTSLIDAREADVLRPASLSTMLGMTGRLTFRPPSAIILRILYMYIYRYLNNFKKNWNKVVIQTSAMTLLYIHTLRFKHSLYEQVKDICYFMYFWYLGAMLLHQTQ